MPHHSWITSRAGNGPLPSGVYRTPCTVSSPLLYETDLEVAANAENEKPMSISSDAVFFMKAPFVTAFTSGLRCRASLGGRVKDPSLHLRWQFQFHVHCACNRVRTVRRDIFKAQHPVKPDRIPHHRFNGIEPHVMIADLARQADCS